MEIKYGKVVQMNNMTIYLNREMIDIDADGGKFADYFTITPASKEWEVKLSEPSEAYQFLRLYLERDMMDFVQLYLINILCVHSCSNPFYQQNIGLLANIAADPMLLEEGYSDEYFSHEKLVETEKNLRKEWLKAYKEALAAMKESSESHDETMDEAADAALGTLLN